jgi:hypothetical protein
MAASIDLVLAFFCLVKIMTIETETHLLRDGFTTACGLARHFECGIPVQVAARIGEVTCEKCRNSTAYDDWKAQLVNEGIHSDKA